MEINKLRSIIKEAIKDTYLKEIESVAENAAMEARLAEYDKAIKMCEDKIKMAESLEEMQDVIDENKIKDIKNKLKNLQKEKGKLEKKKKRNDKGKELVTDEPTEDADVKEGDKYNPENSWNDAEISDPFNDKTEHQPMDEEEAINESFLKMQKLAGVITEAQYNSKKSLIENQLNEFDMDQFSLGSTPKASFEDKWNTVPNANKEVLKKSTGKEPIVIMASSKGSNYLIAKGPDSKFYLYTFTQAANPGEPKGPFNSEQDAKKQVK
jgi:hypothetical protein